MIRALPWASNAAKWALAVRNQPRYELPNVVRVTSRSIELVQKRVDRELLRMLIRRAPERLTGRVLPPDFRSFLGEVHCLNL